MKTTNKIIAVSILAMLAVPAAHAKIVAETMLSEESGHYSSTHTVQSEINAKQATANMVTNTSEYNTDIADATKYPNMPVVNKMISDTQVGLTSRVTSLESGKIDKTVANDANTVMVRGTGGTYVKGSGTDVSVSGTGAITVNHATAADSATSATKDGSGNTISSYYEAKSNVTSKGDTDTPVYFDASGVAKPITAYDGNAATATKATKDGDGNTITTTYATKSELTSSAGDKIDKTIANDKDSLMARDGSGNYVKGTSSDISVATADGTTTVTVTHATAADSATKDGSGNVITSTYATKTENGNKVDKTVANDKNGLIVRNSSGTAAKGTGTDITVSGTTVTVNHATKADQDGSGQNIANTYATKSELTSASGDKVDKTVADDKTALMGRDKDGLAGKVTLTDLTLTSSASGERALSVNKSGSVASGNTGIVTGGTVYTAVNAKQDKTTAVTHTASTAAGSETVPVYVNSSGVATAITSYSGTAAKATADASGNTITSTYATKTENGNKVDKTVSADKNGVIVRNSSGLAMKGTGSDITVSDAGAITVAHATKADQDGSGQNIANTYATKTENGNKVDKTVSADANGLIVRNASGVAAKGTGTDITVSGTAVTVNHATKADQDGSGQNIANTYATKTEVSNNYATKNMELNAVPATPSTEGVYVLTAKITGSGSNAETTYYWEDIGR